MSIFGVKRASDEKFCPRTVKVLRTWLTGSVVMGRTLIVLSEEQQFGTVIIPAVSIPVRLLIQLLIGYPRSQGAGSGFRFVNLHARLP